MDDFPRPRTRWFRNWFYPIYVKYGKGRFLTRFFKLLSENFPQKPYIASPTYARRMNLGEFVHFWSGAAKTNLKKTASDAFGWTSQTNAEFEKARVNFPKVTY